MKETAISVYEASKGAPFKGKIWCCITQSYFNKDNVRAAHIVPHALGPELVDYIFGSGSGSRLDRSDNCLLMHHTAEQAFDKGLFVLLPVDANETPIMRWKIQITNLAAVHSDFMGGRETLDDYDGKVLERHQTLFRPGLGRFNDGIEMPIPFRDESDIAGLKQNPFNLSQRDRRAVDSILDPLVEQGCVEKVPLGTPSAASSPAFVVWKNGKPRVVVDLRKVNTKLYPDAYPLPKQDTILGALGGSVVFSLVDLTVSSGVSSAATVGVRPERRSSSRMTIDQPRGSYTTTSL